MKTRKKRAADIHKNAAMICRPAICHNRTDVYALAVNNRAYSQMIALRWMILLSSKGGCNSSPL